MNSISGSLVQRWPFLLLVFIVTAFDCPAVNAQKSADSATSDLQASNTAATVGRVSERSVNKPDDIKFKDALNLFQHNWWGRFGRAFEYDFQRIEQPTAIVTATGAIVSNPEHYLNEHTLKFQFSELFPSSSTLADAVKNACALVKNSSAKCSPNPPNRWGFRWIASGGGAWRRAVSGFTLNVDLSERPALQQGIVITNASFTDHYQVTGGFDFDPAQLFLSGTNWSKAYDSIKSDNNPALYDRCDDLDKTVDIVVKREKCIHDLSGPRLFSGKEDTPIRGPRKPMLVLAAVVPTVSFKRVSQFDFVKSGGILVPASFLERAQNQLVFKWDLKRAIPISASRTALMPGPNAKQQSGQAQQQQQESGKLCVIISGSVRSYIGVSPHFLEKSCADFAAKTGSRYLLGCVTERGISVGADRPSSAPYDIVTESCWQ